jgi:2-(1,2-epoxy-1,2-dihydrophenyl)acetyl-CoA isomerase
MQSPLNVEHRASAAWLTLNRPDSGNAIDVRLATDLGEAARDLAGNPAVRAIVITGAGKLFCAGGDIRAFGEGDGSSDAINAITSRLHPAIEALLALPKPIVTLVNGPAAGAGLGLALLGDIVLASRAAHFTSAYTAIGLTPDGATSWLLPRLIGLRRAQEMVMTNRRISADEAEKIGLVTRVVEAEQLTVAGTELVDKLVGGAIGSIGAARRLLLDSFSQSLHDHLEEEANLIAARSVTPEGAEGIASFIARRTPKFD